MLVQFLAPNKIVDHACNERHARAHFLDFLSVPTSEEVCIELLATFQIFAVLYQDLAAYYVSVLVC